MRLDPETHLILNINAAKVPNNNFRSLNDLNKGVNDEKFYEVA